MTPLQKKNINVIVPLLVAVYFVYKTDPKLAGYKKTLPIAIGIFLLIWFITHQATSYVQKEQDKPTPGTIPDAVTDKFDAASFCTKLYNDIDCIFCWRDKELYRQLAAYPDTYIIAINSYWNDKYYSKNGETLRVAINGEVLGIMLESTKDTINQRFDKLNIQ
jgi:hypothetical protein